MNDAPKPRPLSWRYGYPPRTPLANMTDGQRAAYWKHHARQHEARYNELVARLNTAGLTPCTINTEQETTP